MVKEDGWKYTEYIAHRSEDGKRSQSIKEHLEGTARLAGQFAQTFGKRDWGYCCGMLHDIGKYSLAFQEKIRNDSGRKVDHATAGAQLCFSKGGLYEAMSYCIAGHHAGLADYGSSADAGSSPSLMGRMRKRLEPYEAYREEIEIPPLFSDPFDPSTGPDFDFSFSAFIRMLYSCLVDADFLDTEAFMKGGETQRDPGESPEQLLKKLEAHIQGWLKTEDADTINGRRTEILKHCLECGAMERGLFRLTVPTGGGKTVASMAFALRHAAANRMDRVIYVIPYTSIIEQNAQVFRTILGEKNVLENHCNIDYDGLTPERSEELKPMQLAAENWDKPVVVTTNVQFFESLFANRSSKCRKLHNIANSVIVFDEAQMLPNDYLKPCIAMMEELLDHYRTSIVLCTATQPALMPFFQKAREVVELCPRREEQFRFFERVVFQIIGTVSEEKLADRLSEQASALCIVNTKKRVQSLYQRLKGEGVFHLSTSMYPKHRRRVLQQIRQRLADGGNCVLISTSLVEAGVDLYFQRVYRELAGVDSIIQAAGRCNREGKRTKEESCVSVFRFEDGGIVPQQRQQIDVTKALLADGVDIASQEGIEKYFAGLYHLRGESLDKKKILEDFRNCRYDFARAASDFRLIEERTTTLMIPIEDEAKELLEQFKRKGYTKTGMRKAQRYCVQIYEKEWKILYGAGMIRPVSEDLEDFWELTDETQYTEEMGLNLGVESGMGLFW